MTDYNDEDTQWYFGIPLRKRVSGTAAAKPEPKFKVGDRVRVIDDAGGGKVGDICTVTSVNSEDYDSEDGQYYQLDGVTEVEGLYGKRLEPFSPPFAIGDRVRVTKDGWAGAGSWHCADVGFVDTVVGFDRNEGRDRVEGEEWFYLPDEIEPFTAAPFAAGDRVKLKRNTSTHAVGDTGVVYAAREGLVGVEMDPIGFLYYFKQDDLAADCPQDNVQQLRNPEDAPSAFTIIADKFTVAPPQPCIVARVLDCQPRPSTIPFVHASVAAATTEAERLAKNNPGQEFAVYQRVGARIAEVQYNMKEVA